MITQLGKTIESSTKSAVQTAVAAGRTCEQRAHLIDPNNPGETGSLVFVANVIGTTVGGHGKILKSFRETGQVTGFPGEGTQLATTSDENYESAPLKLMEFHETFKGACNDVDKSKLINNIF